MLDLEAGGPEIVGKLSYNEGLFSNETMSRMAEHFTVLLSSVAATPDAPISHLTFIQPSERELVRSVACWKIGFSHKLVLAMKAGCKVSLLSMHLAIQADAHCDKQSAYPWCC